MTVRELAKKAGVSAATVSRYFTGSEKVGSEIAKKIEAVLEEMEEDKRPVFGRSRRVGLVVPHMDLAYYIELMKRFMEESAACGINLVMIPINGLDVNQCKMSLKRQRFSGLVFFEEFDQQPLLEFAAEMNIPATVCGETVANMYHAVTLHVNDMLAAYEGTQYLLGLGHQDIVFFANYAKGINASYQRIGGCMKAMEEATLGFGESNVKYGPLTYESGYRFAREIVEQGWKFTALFAFSDEMAMGAIEAFHDMGIRVPEDVSVLGFDDLPLAERVRPRLTTIHQPIDEFVRMTLEILTDDKSRLRGKEIVLPHKIIIRDSCTRYKKE